MKDFILSDVRVAPWQPCDSVCRFLKRAQRSALAVLWPTPFIFFWCALCAGAGQLPVVDYRIELKAARKGYDGVTCFVHPRAGAIPTRAAGNPNSPIVVMTMSKMLMKGSDVFYALHDQRTDDLGKAWDGPRLVETLARRPFPQEGEIVISDFWPQWHAQTGKLLGIGHTVRYLGNAVHWNKNPRSTAYSVYDPLRRTWTEWKTLAVPPDTILESSGAGSVQRYDLPNGDILLPVYCNPVRDGRALPETSTVLRCRFDRSTLKYVEHGNELFFPTGRGYTEPSLAKFGDWFYLTLRNDDFAAVARSRDGLHFEAPRRWTFDDGLDLGSYNTQAHWVTHSDGLFLVYTRRGANNDHVFRHRAPLFMAQVDPERLVVLRSTERILVPQRGARLGNFGVTAVSPEETWVTVAEWMQRWGPDYVLPVDNEYGADNSVYVAKILWARPNILTRSPAAPGKSEKTKTSTTNARRHEGARRKTE